MLTKNRLKKKDQQPLAMVSPTGSDPRPADLIGLTALDQYLLPLKNILLPKNLLFKTLLEAILKPCS